MSEVLTPTSTTEKVSASEFADLALDIANNMLASGAHCGRITRNLNRMAKHWNLELQMQLTFTGATVSVTDHESPSHTVTRYHNSPSTPIHLAYITEFSRLTWRVADGELTFEQVKEEMARIKKTKHYSPLTIAIAVGLSCSCLCTLAGGGWIDAIVTCVGAFAGSIIRAYIIRHRFNPIMSNVVASFITTMISGANMTFHWGSAPEAALATAVLYLVPGVPLINSLIDLIEGYLSSSWNRALYGAYILLCIAVGMTLSIALWGINNF